jgi:hypothetical protein
MGFASLKDSILDQEVEMAPDPGRREAQPFTNGDRSGRAIFED